MTGTEFLTGVLRWFLFQNGNFQRVAETAADHKTHCRQPIWFNAAIAARCDCPIRSAPIADTMPARKSSTWAKRPRKNKVYREKKRTVKSVFLLTSFVITLAIGPAIYRPTVLPGLESCDRFHACKIQKHRFYGKDHKHETIVSLFQQETPDSHRLCHNRLRY